MIKKVVSLSFSTRKLPDGKFECTNHGSELINLINPEFNGDPVGSIINKLKKNEKTLDLKEKDKIAFLPLCTVPRVKLKSYLEDLKVSVTRDLDKAQYIFYSPESIACVIKNYWGFSIKTEIVKDIFDSCPESLVTKEYKEIFDKLISEAEYKDKILIDYTARRSLVDICEYLKIDTDQILLDGKTLTKINSKRLNYISDNDLAY